MNFRSRTKWRALALFAAHLLCFLSLSGLRANAHTAAPSPVLNSIHSIEYHGHAALKISDGLTEAVIVPALSRIMAYETVDGENWLWNAPADHKGSYPNWGGDKTWLAPQLLWPALIGHAWPPDADWDASPSMAQVTPDGHVILTSRISRALGVGLRREIWIDETGRLVIQQTAQCADDRSLTLALWNDVQIAHAQAVYLPLNPSSAYTEQYAWLSKTDRLASISRVSNNLLKVVPGHSSYYKIGVDVDTADIAAIRGGQMFIAQEPIPGSAQYPDGADNCGFPVEFYNHADPGDGQFVELELLSPLEDFKKGASYSSTIYFQIVDAKRNVQALFTGKMAQRP